MDREYGKQRDNIDRCTRNPHLFLHLVRIEDVKPWERDPSIPLHSLDITAVVLLTFHLHQEHI